MTKFTLVDMSVVIYQVYFRNYKWFNPLIHKEEALIPFLLKKIEELIKPAIDKDYQPVYIFDKKRNNKYWRQEFIENNVEFYRSLWDDPTTGRGKNIGSGPNDEAYKGARLKPKDYNPVLNYTRKAAELLKEKSHWFETPGLEADDLFGLLVKYKPDNVHLDLLTVDRDIAGLLQLDNLTIRFVDLYPKRRYSIHYAEDIVEYFQNKLHPDIKTPAQAYYWKQQLGEAADNLKPGCHIELIDLVNHCAPLEYGFTETHEQIKNFYAASGT